MPQSIRKHGEMPLQNSPGLGVRVTCDIPLTADLESLELLLSGTVTLSTGASALVTDGIANIIQSVELIGDGRDTIVSLPFNQLVNGNMFRRKYGNLPVVTQPGLTIAAHSYEVSAMLDLATFAGVRPKDSSVRENRYRTLQLLVRFAGDWTGVFTGGGFVVSANTFDLVVRARECIELPDPATGIASAPIMRPLVSARDDNFSAAVERQHFRLTPDQIMRGIGLRVLNSSGALSDSILKRVRVYVGKDLRLDYAAASLKKANKTEMAGTVPTGYYFLDFADGQGSPDRLNDCLDLRQEVTRGADCYLEYDTLAQGAVNIAQYGYQPT